ncbi:hypothetical protein [Succinivibrio dextrinosolvens]|uniref:hypothetical protein n=1 Tax=Succinivibrio dextrinosolvens TaxID=83771 RepID=UPI00241F2B6D|nr:hypothetical protein [Succinivibrio dextrinosolvens]MBE6422597.1 hypothetical protein [Succinivibrio dextrinosolvens]
MIKTVCYIALTLILFFIILSGTRISPDEEMIQKKKIYTVFTQYKPAVGENVLDRNKLVSVLCHGHNLESCKAALEGESDEELEAK